MTRDQIKYCGAIMRNLKKHRDAAPFLHPVDYVKLNVPDYPKIIKHPMDLSTVDRRLNANQYQKVEDFVQDIRLVFNNCFKFNGPEAMISMLCQNVESAFEKSLRQMPPSRGVSLEREKVNIGEWNFEKKKWDFFLYYSLLLHQEQQHPMMIMKCLKKKRQSKKR
jgi:hypothetical protein